MHTSRRTFLAQAALAPLILPSLRGQVAPSERLTTALIGHGVMGRGHLRVLASRPESQLVAMCDVDQTRRDDAVAQVPGLPTYNDYRELLARDDIDAVVIVTPDHWHSQISIEAARAGKDVYCEKPVSLTIREGRQLADTMTRYARVFQTGTQYRSIPTIRRVCEFVRHGGLGQVKSVFTKWGKGSRFPGANPYIPVPNALPGEPVPASLDWDLWLGPAPRRPSNLSRIHV